MDISRCPICDYDNPYYRLNPSNDTYFFNCPRCKTFIISEEMLTFDDKKEKLVQNKDRLSGLTRLLAETETEPLAILTTNIDDILKDKLIPDREDINKKASILLDAIRRRTKNFGAKVKLDWKKDYPLAFAADVDEAVALLNFLADKGDLQPIFLVPGGANVKITASGWQLKKKLELNQGFIAVWFDKAGSMDEAIRNTEEAIRECNYSPMCIKEEHYPETIMEKALGEIQRSLFVIVNLTGQRNSVFFEAGFAHALGIDLIYVCDIKEIEKFGDFYSKHYKIYFYENGETLKSQLIDIINFRIRRK